MTRVEATNVSLSISFPEPELRNGVIVKYFICLRVVDSSPGPCLRDITVATEAEWTEYTITELHPYTEYSFTISAGTVIGLGPSVKVVTKTLQAGNLPHNLQLHNQLVARSGMLFYQVVSKLLIQCVRK